MCPRVLVATKSSYDKHYVVSDIFKLQHSQNKTHLRLVKMSADSGVLTTSLCQD